MPDQINHPASVQCDDWIGTFAADNSYDGFFDVSPDYVVWVVEGYEGFDGFRFVFYGTKSDEDGSIRKTMNSGGDVEVFIVGHRFVPVPDALPAPFKRWALTLHRRGVNPSRLKVVEGPFDDFEWNEQ